MLRSSRSWRGRRTSIYRRKGIYRRVGLPPAVKKIIVESIYGAIFALITFPIALFIAELGVWVMIVWMQPYNVIMSNFYVTLVMIQALFLLIPAYNKQPARLMIAALVAYALWSTLVGMAEFHPIYSIFGKLPY